MKKSVSLTTVLLFIAQLTLFGQPQFQIDGKEVYKGEDVVFHQIDEDTWVGTGKMMSNESLYLVEGNDKSVLIDAGTNIKDLDKIVASITEKPVMLVATHVHPDHTGASIDYFSELFINPADSVGIPQFMPNYKGDVKFLKDREIIDLGGRQLEVVFTPGHTPGSTTFLDKNAKYGFSGDSFGSGNLLLSTNFSTLQSTCKKTSKIMAEYGIDKFYPGHYFGGNPETKKRVDDLKTISDGALSGRIKGEENPNGFMGLNLLINQYGVRVNYSKNALK
ncbi:MBL fold metallo-hydrolase [Maribellus maritimus]|uniref:MBL fold metallo-hydrolase n=1 Tax=Maribellus maritimus TaxID=2870838 RepID=UPI001EEC73DA|nr:MBL fold metallo-hydrolase [Maribellus maritimus]MCG6190993.1 MBL fold metallo-hydrolase [Maribellus maritimus]